MADRISQQSPIQQYLSLKNALPRGMILFMSIGDYYETYGEDAQVSAPIIGTALKIIGENLICGFLRGDVCIALAKLIRTGKSVALANRSGDGVFRVIHTFN